jgi:SAM-dependent methyltransferase
MPANQAEWDEKHRVAAEAPPAEPASIVRELLPLLPRGLVLDLACGLGRHSLLLAAQGQRVVAIDASAVALETVEKRAQAAHLEVRHSPRLDDAIRSHAAGIHLLQANLDDIYPEAYCSSKRLLAPNSLSPEDRAIRNTYWNPASCEQPFRRSTRYFIGNFPRDRESPALRRKNPSNFSPIASSCSPS